MASNITQKKQISFPIGLPVFLLSLSLFVVSFVKTTEALEAENHKKNGNGTEAVLRIFPKTQIPEDLTYEAFEVLGPNWEEWIGELNDALYELYEGEDLTLKKQDELLKIVEKKVETMKNSINDPDYFMIKKPLTELHGRLSRLAQVARITHNILSTDMQAVYKKQLEQSLPTVDAQIINVETYLNGIKNGDAWIKHLNLKEIKEKMTKGDPKRLSELLELAAERLNPYNLEGEKLSAFVSRPQLTEFRNAIMQFRSALDGANRKFDWSSTQQTLSELIQKIDKFENDQTFDASASIRESLVNLAKVSPVVSNDLDQVILRNYMNYNFRVVASEDFLRRVLSEAPRQETGPVRDCILGARVYGNQCTVTDVLFDLHPHDGGIRFTIDLSGKIHARTRGVTDQATVWTTGNHRFYASKGVVFDGTNFSTEPGKISVDANNNITNARIHHRGLITALLHLDEYALKKAREKRSQTEAIARSRVRDQTLPRFNTEVDSEFSNRGKELEEKVFDPLRELGLYPDVMAFRSTDNALKISSRLMQSGELAANRPIIDESTTTGATVQIHESWMNNAIARINDQIAGKTLTEIEVRDILHARLEKLLGRELEKKEDTESGKKNLFTFAKKDPIRFKVTNGELILVIKTALKPEGKDEIPTCKIIIPIMLKLVEGEVIIKSSEDVNGEVTKNVLVEVIDESVPNLRRGIMNRLMKSEIEKILTEKEEKEGALMKKKASFVFKAEKRDVNLTLTQLLASNGWLVLSVE